MNVAVTVHCPKTMRTVGNLLNLLYPTPPRKPNSVCALDTDIAIEGHTTFWKYIKTPRHYNTYMLHYPWPSLVEGLASRFLDRKVYGGNMGPTWVRQDPGGPHVGPMNLAICVVSVPNINLHQCRLVVHWSQEQTLLEECCARSRYQEKG